MEEANPQSDPRVSPKKYGTAVIVSALFGFAGLQHFYLGRYGLAFLDLGLTIAWIVCFGMGETILGVTFLAIDSLHALWVTFELLTGSFRDGQGRLVCYPGQRLRTAPPPTMTRSTIS